MFGNKIMMSELGMAPFMHEDSRTFRTLRPSSSETRTSVPPPHCTHTDLPYKDVSS